MNKNGPRHKPQTLVARSAVRLGAALLLSVMVWSTTPAVLAAVSESADVPGPRVSSPFFRGIQGILGINKMAAIIGERHLEREIRRKVQGDVDVDLKPYSGYDLAQGKARELRIQGKNLLVDKTFYVSRFDLQTDRNTPIWVDLDNGKLKSPLNARVSIRIDQDDFNRSFATPALQDKLNRIEVPLLASNTQTIRLVNPQVAMRPERLLFSSRVGIAGKPSGGTLPLEVETGLKPTNDARNLELTDMEIKPIPGIDRMDAVEDLFSQLFSDVISPQKMIPLEGGDFRIDRVRVSSGNLLLEGRLRLVPVRASST